MERITQLLETYHTILITPERLIIAAGALLLSCIFGLISGPRLGHANPAWWSVVSAATGRTGERLNKAGRKPADLLFRGFMLSIFALILALAIEKLLTLGLQTLPLYGFIQMILLSCLITSGAVWVVMLKLHSAMEDKKTPKNSYSALVHTMRESLTQSDNFAITRAGIGMGAHTFTKGCVNPLFWFILAGLPGALIYSTLAALTWRFSQRGQGTAFGAAPASLEKLMGVVPSVFAGTLLTLATIAAPTASITKSIQLLFTKKGKATYDQGGIALSAIAWALEITLGGPFETLGGTKFKAPWVGPVKATAKIDHTHLKRALLLGIVAHLLLLAALFGAYVWSQVLG